MDTRCRPAARRAAPPRATTTAGAVLRQRAFHADVEAAAQARGFTALQARVLAGRLRHTSELAAINCPLRALDPPTGLPDIDRAAEVIAAAIVSGRKLVLCTDHDCDGAASHYVLRSALLDYFHLPAEQVIPFITHRMKEGYGVSDTVVDRMLETLPDGALMITADQGSTDEARIARLKAERNVDTVVTDHHGIPREGPPKSAVACVNPCRTDSSFDPFIAGCAVAWYVMCAVRQKLMASGRLPPTTPSLAGLLDIVAVGTCADAVSLASKNNRVFLTYGLRLMNGDHPRPCWGAMRKVMDRNGPFVTRDISHGLAPRINARGRLGDAMASVDFLAAASVDAALPIARVLDAENQARRKIQDAMTTPAMAAGVEQAAAGRAALVVFLPTGHPGVHGIVASRLVETYGRPTCMLAPDPNDPSVARGSLRSIPEVDIRAALAQVAAAHPGVLPHFGGHRGAAGIGLAVKDIESFADALCAAVAAQADPGAFAPVALTDGALPVAPSLEALRELEQLEPFGREFEPPQFCDTFTVAAVRSVGDGSHLKLTLSGPDGRAYGGIWFRALEPGAQPPVRVGEVARFIYTMAANTFRGKTSLDLIVSQVVLPTAPAAPGSDGGMDRAATATTPREA